MTRAERNAYARRWYRAHRDDLLERQRKYREHNADRVRASKAAYRAAHRQELSQAERIRRIENGDALRARENELRSRKTKWFGENLRILKAAQGCADCGKQDARLDYHHLDKSTKRFNVSKMASASLESFIDEVAKCVVLCAACHTKRHHRSRIETFGPQWPD